MKRNKLIGAVAVLALGATMAIASPEAMEGQGGWHGHHHGRQEFGRKFAEKLNLSDAQKQQIKDAKQSFRAENEAFFKTLRQTHQDFRAATKAGDTAKADALKATMQAQRAEMKARMATLEAKVGTILTPEQNTQWQQMKAERAARREARKG